MTAVAQPTATPAPRRPGPLATAWSPSEARQGPRAGHSTPLSTGCAAGRGLAMATRGRGALVDGPVLTSRGWAAPAAVAYPRSMSSRRVLPPVRYGPASGLTAVIEAVERGFLRPRPRHGSRRGLGRDADRPDAGGGPAFPARRRGGGGGAPEVPLPRPAPRADAEGAAPAPRRLTARYPGSQVVRPARARDF